MTVNLYRQISETNKIEKTLTEPITLEGSFRGVADALNPTLSIQSADNLSDYNFLYIPDFARYYFIDSIVAIRTNLWEVRGRVDVLMSYASAIKNLSGIVRRSASSFNEEIKDEKLVMLNRTSIQGKKLVGNFSREAEYPFVLVVAGISDPSNNITE